MPDLTPILEETHGTFLEVFKRRFEKTILENTVLFISKSVFNTGCKGTPGNLSRTQLDAGVQMASQGFSAGTQAGSQMVLHG